VSGRIANIDVARGIAALLVLLQHSIEQSGLHAPWAVNLGQTGVASFFLVSGFVIPIGLEKSGSLRRFAANRMLRILPLYYACLVAWLVLGRSVTPADLYANVLLAQDWVAAPNVVGVSWTLSVEMVWYAGFAGLFAAGLNRSAVLITTGTVGVILLAAVLPFLGFSCPPMGRMLLVASCVVGLLTYRIYSGEDRGLHFQCLSLVAAAILFGMWVRFQAFPPEHGDAGSFSAILTAWALGYAIFYACLLAPSWGVLAKPLTFLGAISYSVYMLHEFVLRAVHLPELSGPAYLAAVSTITIPLAYLSYRWIEVPCAKLDLGKLGALGGAQRIRQASAE
jgi:peptidoglycan/LPS O-acetylase OafA/YrhL